MKVNLDLGLETVNPVSLISAKEAVYRVASQLKIGVSEKISLAGNIFLRGRG